MARNDPSTEDVRTRSSDDVRQAPNATTSRRGFLSTVGTVALAGGVGLVTGRETPSGNVTGQESPSGNATGQKSGAHSNETANDVSFLHGHYAGEGIVSVEYVDYAFGGSEVKSYRKAVDCFVDSPAVGPNGEMESNPVNVYVASEPEDVASAAGHFQIASAGNVRKLDPEINPSGVVVFVQYWDLRRSEAGFSGTLTDTHYLEGLDQNYIFTESLYVPGIPEYNLVFEGTTMDLTFEEDADAVAVHVDAPNQGFPFRIEFHGTRQDETVSSVISDNGSAETISPAFHHRRDDFAAISPSRPQSVGHTRRESIQEAPRG